MTTKVSGSHFLPRVLATEPRLATTACCRDCCPISSRSKSSDRRVFELRHGAVDPRWSRAALVATWLIAQTGDPLSPIIQGPEGELVTDRPKISALGDGVVSRRSPSRARTTKLRRFRPFAGLQSVLVRPEQNFGPQEVQCSGSILHSDASPFLRERYQIGSGMCFKVVRKQSPSMMPVEFSRT